MAELFAHEHQAQHWVLVADQSRAKIFTIEKNGSDKQLEFLEKLDHPEARMHDGDLVTDSPGEALSQTGGGGVAQRAMDPPTDPSDHEANVFAKEVAEHLNSALHDQRYTHLTLVAGPVAMGKLRNELSPQVQQAIAAEHAKNLSQSSTDDIAKTIDL